MTPPKATPTTPVEPRIDGQPAAAWITEHRRLLVDAALQILLQKAADRVTMDRAVSSSTDQAAELRWIVAHNIDLFVRLASRDPDSELTEHEASDLIASAARRAGDGEPIENLLVDYQVGADAMWRAIAEHAQPGEQPDLVALVDLLHRYLRQVTSFVVRGFQHEADSMRLGERDARFGLYSALVTGQDFQGAAELASIPLPEHYVVVSLHLEPDLAPAVSGRAPQVASRRRVNAVQRAVRRHGDGALALVRDPLATALVPATDDVSASGVAAALVDELTAALGLRIHAAAALAAPQDVASAHRVTGDVLEIALATGRAPGVLTLDDVLVPYQLTRPGPATDRIRELLRPLDSHPDWEATLRAYLASSFDRRAAATALHVHPNTVDYRLSRIAAACGFDPSDPAQRLAAFAGLHLRDLDRYRASGRPAS